METFTLVLFWLILINVVIRLFLIAFDAHNKPVSLSVYAADTVIQYALCIWAGFVLWY